MDSATRKIAPFIRPKWGLAGMATALYPCGMSPASLQRLWDWLPRFAALIACVLMLWPLAKTLVERHLAERHDAATPPSPVVTNFKITRSELQVDGSAAYWAAVATVEGRQPERYPRPRLLAVIRDIEGNEVFRTPWNASDEPVGPDADGVRTWTFRIENPRTLAAERYHTLSASLIDDR
jgi:hypothetical protein